MSRQVDFAAGANTSRRVDLATRADTYRWVDFVAGAICLDRSTWPLESKCLGLTWLPELTSLQRADKSRQVGLVARSSKSRQVDALKRVDSAASQLV